VLGDKREEVFVRGLREELACDIDVGPMLERIKARVLIGGI